MAQTAAAEVKPMNQYETIMWEDKMKERILSHARAIHGEICCQGSVFDVVHTTVKISDDLTYCETHLIIYEMLKSNNKWRVLDSTQKNESVTDGLNTLMEKLKEQMRAFIKRKEQQEQQELIAEEKEKKYGYY